MNVQWVKMGEGSMKKWKLDENERRRPGRSRNGQERMIDENEQGDQGRSRNGQRWTEKK